MHGKTASHVRSVLSDQARTALLGEQGDQSGGSRASPRLGGPCEDGGEAADGLRGFHMEPWQRHWCWCWHWHWHWHWVSRGEALGLSALYVHMSTSYMCV